MRICAATGNAGKLRELRRILEAQGHEVVSQKELGITMSTIKKTTLWRLSYQ